MITTPKTKLHVFKDSAASFRFNKEQVSIGSLESADIRLVGAGIAPVHAVIEFQPTGPVLYDLASESGIYVNGNKVVTHALKLGDLIKIGNRELKYGIEEIGGVPTQRPAEEAPILLVPENLVHDNIFDYGASIQKALEVVMSWEGMILDVEHFVKEKEVTVGTERKTDFAVPEFSSRRFNLIDRLGEEFVLNIEPGMKGVIQRDGKLQGLQSFDRKNVSLKPGDFAKISIGTVDFYLSYTAAPPRLRRKRVVEPDAFFFKVLGSSLILTVALIVALLKIQVPQTVEAEKLPDRIASILYQPEKYAYHPNMRNVVDAPPEQKQKKPSEDDSKKVTKLDIKPNQSDMDKHSAEISTGKKAEKNLGSSQDTKKAVIGQNEAREGKGARAKGKEGTRGTKNGKTFTEKQNTAMRPSPNGGKGRGGADSQVTEEGDVDLLKGAGNRIQDLLGSSAAKLGKGGEKLQGFGSFTSQGGGGLALSGEAKGGGGNAESLGGLADTGKGGGRVGTGLGAAGSGNGIVGGKARVVIRSGGPEEAVVMGSVDASAIEAALMAHKDEFRLCYEKELNAYNPRLSGLVNSTFTIGNSGRVDEAGVSSSTLKNPNVERCILVVIKRIDFPKPRGGGIVQVSFPFKFSSAR